MTIQEVKYPQVEVKIALGGQDGNAFVVLGKCKQAAVRAGLSEEEIKEWQKEAMAGDYDHLLATCMNFFTCDFTGLKDMSEEEADAEWDEHWEEMDEDIHG